MSNLTSKIWEVVQANQSFAVIDREAQGQESDTDYPVASQVPTRTEAQLIAAAPELLAALAGLVSVYDSVTMGQERERRAEWLPKARAALAKMRI